MSNNFGRRLLCNVLHEEARSNPHRLFAITAQTNDISDGYHFVTFQQVERAVNHLSAWLQSRFEAGGQPTPGSTLCYIGLPDLRYSMIIYAAIKCRYKIFLPSPRNPSAVNLSMLEQTECVRLVYASEVTPVVEALKSDAQHLVCEPISALRDLLDLPDTTFPYELEYSQVWREPIIILHSSGSTGLPKTVTWTHGTVAAVDYRDWPSVEGRRNHDFAASLRFANRQEGRLLDPFPPFHSGGVMTKVLTPIWNLTAVIFGPAQRPPSGALIAQMMRELSPNGVLLPPSIGEQILQESDCGEIFSRLDYAMFGGGPVSRSAAEKISAWTTIISAFGSTETIHVRQLVTAPEDFDHVEFHPDEHLELQPIGNDLYEMVFQVREEFAQDFALYHNFQNLSEWRSRDLFQKHPIKPNLWKFYGRVDDIVVFSSGEKLSPLPLEQVISSIPAVSGALVIGQGRPQPILLVETAPDKGPLTIEALWPAIEAANSLVPGFGRISKSMILFTDPDRPLKRAAKGTVIRKLSEDLYAKDADVLFHDQTLTRNTMATLIPSAFRHEDVESAVRSILREVSVGAHVGKNDNLYVSGLDSIKTTEVLRQLKASLEASRSGAQLDWLTIETLYFHPTISKLTSVILTYLNNGIIPEKPNKIRGMENLIQKYTLNLPEISQLPEPGIPTGQLNIIITGTTGFFGPYLLDSLLKRSIVNRIYCLNRSPTAEAQFGRIAHPGSQKNLVFFQCDISAPKFGLIDQDYSNLLNDCNLILHNAWTVDFNLAVDSFQHCLQSLRNLIDFSAAAAFQPRIVFVSTIAATGGWASQGSIQEVVPEGFVEDLGTTMENGYAESKRVAEHVLQAAAATTGIATTVLRVGHLVPDMNGILPPQDYITVFLRTCRGLGLIASDIVDAVDWLPASIAAEIVGDVVEWDFKNPRNAGSQVFNLVNVEQTPWSEMLPTIDSWVGSEAKCVSMREWVHALKTRSNDTHMIHQLPALLLLPLFEKLAMRGPTHKYAQTKLMAISPGMAKLESIKKDVLQSWLQRL